MKTDTAFDPDLAFRLGRSAMDRAQTASRAYIEEYCDTLRVAAEPEVQELKIQQRYHLGSLESIYAKLSRCGTAISVDLAVPYGSLVVAALSVVGACLIAIDTLSPFNLGVNGNLWCIAVSLGVPAAIDRLLAKFSYPKLHNVFIVGTAVAAICTAAYFGSLRGQVLGLSLDAAPAADIEGLPTKDLSVMTVDAVTKSLTQFFGLAGVFLELIGSLCLHHYLDVRRKIGASDIRVLKKEAENHMTQLRQINGRLATLISAPQQERSRFWMRFRQGIASVETGAPWRGR